MDSITQARIGRFRTAVKTRLGPSGGHNQIDQSDIPWRGGGVLL